MWRHCDVGKRKQRIVGSGGFLCIYIQTGAGDPTAVQRFVQIGFIDNCAARGIEQVCRRAYPC